MLPHILNIGVSHERVCNCRHLPSCKHHPKVFQRSISVTHPRTHTHVCARMLYRFFSMDKHYSYYSRGHLNSIGHLAFFHIRVIFTVIGILYSCDTGLFRFCCDEPSVLYPARPRSCLFASSQTLLSWTDFAIKNQFVKHIDVVKKLYPPQVSKCLTSQHAKDAPS